MFCTSCGKRILDNSQFCEFCGASVDPIIESRSSGVVPKSNKTKLSKGKKIVLWTILAIVILLVVIYLVEPFLEPTEEEKQEINRQVISSVVNVWCPSYDGEFSMESEGTGGSGTILYPEGIIITNSHLFPQDDEFIYIHEKGCFIILPDPDTGLPSEIYLGDPIVIPELSDNYDLAFIETYDVYTDPDDGYVYGSYPKEFPFFDDTYTCTDEYIKLGEPLTVYGYPSISGGYSLTITEGIVSSFTEDGLIVTSAKISEGNSGGLVVDRHGCMLGIPTLISFDEYETLGIIIPSELIVEFIEQAFDLMEDADE